MIDAIVVQRTASGEIKKVVVSDLTLDEAQELGAIVGGLVGLGAAGEEGVAAGAQAGMDTMTERGGHIFDAYEPGIPSKTCRRTRQPHS